MSEKVLAEFVKSPLRDTRRLIEQFVSTNEILVLDEQTVNGLRAQVLNESAQKKKEAFANQRPLQYWFCKISLPLIVLYVILVYVVVRVAGNYKLLPAPGWRSVVGMITLALPVFFLMKEDLYSSLSLGEDWRQESLKNSELADEYTGDLLQKFPCGEIHPLDSSLILIAEWHPESDVRFLKILDPDFSDGGEYYVDVWLKPKQVVKTGSKSKGDPAETTDHHHHGDAW